MDVNKNISFHLHFHLHKRTFSYTSLIQAFPPLGNKFLIFCDLVLPTCGSLCPKIKYVVIAILISRVLRTTWDTSRWNEETGSTRISWKWISRTTIAEYVEKSYLRTSSPLKYNRKSKQRKFMYFKSYSGI